MHKKFYIIFIGLILIFSSIFLVYTFIPSLFSDAWIIKSSRNNRINTYVNTRYQVQISYHDSDQMKKVNENGFDLILGGATKPITVQFEFVNYISLDTWLTDQMWKNDKQNYDSRTIKYPVIFNESTQTMYVMIRPGTLVTIKNGLSSERHFFSIKVLWDIVENIELH